MKDTETATQLRQFVAEKIAQADASTNEPAPGFAPFFAAAKKGDWLAVSNCFNELRQHAGQYQQSGATDERLRGTRWAAVMEVLGAFEAFGGGDEKYAAAFGRDVLASIPPGSIYFGGTDPGRFVVTAMCRSQVNGDPIFVLTQNALADGGYLDYLRQMYGSKLYIPSNDDLQRCFEDYTTDLQKRRQNHELKPGEDFKLDANGHVQVSGQIGVMAINGLLAKVIFDKNPDHEFYLEESFPLDWMYPQLEPHGLIIKINQQPRATLPDEVVQADHDYWAKYVQPIIGDWLKDETPVATVAEFGEKTFGRQDFKDFQGDRHFIQNTYAHRMFSKLRSSIGGLYAWRVNQPGEGADKERMARAADFAFRQAWALCPYSPEAVYRYVNFLVAQDRTDDALMVAETTAKLPQSKGNAQIKQLVSSLKQMHGKKPPA
ncbi:MAG TPA: hypothetical protein VL970_15225 [Candidatus Acidoferrales bacterium]|nr:hypothetical protein [Candidatus Acidoferrales bacterium]